MTAARSPGPTSVSSSVLGLVQTSAIISGAPVVLPSGMQRVPCDRRFESQGTHPQVNAGTIAPITAVQFGAYQFFQQAISKVTGA